MTKVDSNLTVASHTASGLLRDTTYYWRVVVWERQTMTQGSVWHFTTSGNNPQVSSIVLNPTGAAPLCAIINYPSQRPCKTEIIIMGKHGSGSNVAHQFNDWGSSHADTVVGLYGGFANTVEVMYLDTNSNSFGDTTVTITTPVLSAGIPASITADSVQGSVEPGMNLVSSWDVFNPRIPYIVDRYGDIRWILNFSGNPALSGMQYDCGIARLHNGHYFFGDITSNEIYEVDLVGTIINKWALPGYSFEHTVTEEPDGNFLVTVSKNGSTNSNGVATIEDYVIEVARSGGAVLHEWNLKALLNAYRYILPQTTASDWFHGNAVIYDSTDNTIIVSGRFQGVVKLTYDNTIKWILAPHRGWGKNGNGTDLNAFLLNPLDASGNPISDTSVINGWTNSPDFEWNWYQHAPILIPNGDLLLFDNGSTRNFDSTATTHYSRVVEYRINPTNMTVQQVWSYGEKTGSQTYSALFSSVQYLPQTNHVLFCPGYQVPTASGSGGKIIEIDYATQAVIQETDITTPTSNGICFHRSKRITIYP